MVSSKKSSTFAADLEKINGAIAQLVEQRTENPCVPGSIPGGTTKKTSIIRSLFCTIIISKVIHLYVPPKNSQRKYTLHAIGNIRIEYYHG